METNIQSLEQRILEIENKLNKDVFSDRDVSYKFVDMRNRFKIPYYTTVPTRGELGEIVDISNVLKMCTTASETSAVYSDISSSLALFGNGVDGDATISSGTTTITRDMYYNNLTLTGSAFLNTNGYRVFVKGTLTIGSSGSDTCYVGWVGNNGSAGTNATTSAGQAGGAGGAALTGNTVPGGIAGIVGGTGANARTNLNDEAGVTSSAGSTGVSATDSLGGTPSTSTGIGGTGGNYAGFQGGTSGAVGSAGTKTAALSQPSSITDAIFFFNPITFTVYKSSPSSGGSVGGGSGAHAINDTGGGGGGGGGSGSSGGFVCVYANTIVNYVTGGINSKGGNGGAGGNGANAVHNLGIGAGGGGGGGGGNGGTGGVVVVVYKSLTQTGSFLASGGSGGSGGAAGNSAGSNTTPATAGTAGATGGSGTVWQIQV